MTRLECRTLVPLLCVLLPSASLAQTGGEYHPSTEPRFYRSVNPYHMYLVRGGDTLGEPVRSVAVERQLWTKGADGLHVIVDQQQLNVDRGHSADTFDLAPNGRVRAINGRADQLRGRYDLVPRFAGPASKLEVGASWRDSLGSAGPGPAGPYEFTIVREYRVVRQLDSLGQRLVEITADGTVRYRDAYWVDSTAGTATWLDVAGPVSETVLFSPARGELVSQAWEMDLRGRGTTPSDDGVDTLPAGLRSASVQQLVGPELGALLMRPLPGTDTTYTLAEQGVLFLHTTGRTATQVVSSLVRNDGLVGTVRLTHVDGRPERFEAAWTDSTVRRTEILERGDSLEIRGDEPRRVALPAGAWSIADYAMGELVAPALLSLPRDGEPHDLAVYRPVAGKWDHYEATVREAANALIATIAGNAEAGESVYLMTVDGDVLFVENSGPTGARRIPRPDSPRFAELQALVQELQRQP